MEQYESEPTVDGYVDILVKKLVDLILEKQSNLCASREDVVHM